MDQDSQKIVVNRSHLLSKFIVVAFIFSITGFLVGVNVTRIQTASEHTIKPTEIPLMKPTTILPTIIPTDTIQPSLSLIKWKSFNDRGQVNFSMQIPDVGNYCNGCFDGTGGLPEGVSLEQIEGGMAPPDYAAQWLIVIGIFDTNYQFEGNEWGMPSGPVLQRLKSMTVGTTIDIRPQYTVTRLPDKTIGTTPVLIYKTNFFALSNATSKNFAIITQNGKNMVISFEYNGAKYTDAFEHMINSISFSLLNQADYNL